MQEKYKRITAETLKDPYFIEQRAGGLNPCIRRPQGSILRVQNCVYWVWYCFSSSAGKPLLASVNAENFVNTARVQGLSVGDTPKLGAVICWRNGEVGNGADGAGHAGFVVEMDGNHIVTSESGWNNSNQAVWMTTRYQGSDGNWGQSAAYQFEGFIYLPENTDIIVPTAPVRRGEQGAAVRWLQTRLSERGYYYYDHIDGDFGSKTFGAVLAFQFDRKLEVDGVCGPMTRKALLE